MFNQLELNDPRAAAVTEVGTKWVADAFFSGIPLSLATLRLHAGLSQTELGKRLDVTQPQIAKWEKGETPNMQIRSVLNLAKALSIDVCDLFRILVGGDEDRRNEC
jgi:DNA-binding XRE family transcriptional regulator